jgi:hypothetical protein
MPALRYVSPLTVRLMAVDMAAIDAARLDNEGQADFVRAAVRQFTTLRLMGLCGAVLSLIEARQQEIAKG